MNGYIHKAGVVLVVVILIASGIGLADTGIFLTDIWSDTDSNRVVYAQDGNEYVIARSDGSGNDGRILYAKNGSFVGDIAGLAYDDSQDKITFSQNGSIAYIADGTLLHVVDVSTSTIKYSVDNTKEANSILSVNTSDGGENIMVPSGTNDNSNRALRVYDSNLNFIRETAGFQFGGGLMVANNTDHTAYQVIASNWNIEKVDEDGNGIYSNKLGDNQPHGIAIKGGYVYVLESVTEDLYKINGSDGSLVWTVSLSSIASTTMSLTAHPDSDYIWASGASTALVDPNGTVVDTLNTGAGDSSLASYGGKLQFYTAGSDEVQRWETSIDSGNGGGGPTLETNLEIEITSWMALDSTQSYEVILNKTNTTSGKTNLTDVTNDANVTVYNITNTTGFSEPIATVNNTSDTIRSYNETGVIAVNATWNGEQANAMNVTVASRNLGNIGILPPGQWVCGFLECDGNEDGEFYIGSTTQWLIFIVIVSAGFGRAFDNDWIGIGLGMLTAILLWVVGFVGLGMMLSVTFFGIFVGVMKVRVANKSGGETTVNINDTREFR